MKFTQWDIPFALIPLKSYEVETRINWRAAALKAFPSVSKSRVDILTKAYWKKHAHKQFVSTQHFLNDLTLAIGNRYPMACVQLRHDLIALLTQIFVLQMHGFTDILNCSPIFEEWTSINPSDVPFGAKLWESSLLHAGTNAFFFHERDSKLKTQGLLDLLSKSLQSKAPTRFICVIPKQENLPSQFLEIVNFKASAPLFVSNGQFALSLLDMSVVLAMNKESMITDPINWEAFKNRIRKWSEHWPKELLSISDFTNALFNERTQLFHPSRSLTKPAQ